jgi:hypothetical protein
MQFQGRFGSMALPRDSNPCFRRERAASKSTSVLRCLSMSLKLRTLLETVSILVHPDVS